jgi:zinc transport system ATP-binding protein
MPDPLPQTAGQCAPSAQPEPAPLIRATGLGIKRGGCWLIHDIDLSVSPGEIVTLIGPNGGGKTTVLRALLGLIEPNAGEVWRRPELTVGYLPQKLHIDTTLPLTVARLMTATHRHSRDEVIAALAQTGVDKHVDQPVQSLSGGELQRVLLARALLGRPELLVLDEPVQGVDYAGEATLYELIAGIRNQFACGVLLVSHDLHVVMAATDRVICLNHHVCCTGAPQEVTRDAEYRRLFGPRAVEAYALYQHAHDHDHDLAGEVVPCQPTPKPREATRRDA